MTRFQKLKDKSKQIRIQTLEIHKKVPETRVASSLSAVEIFVSLFYGNFLKFNPQNPQDDSRDRLIISKGHGSICMYPLLADLGFFDKKELDKVSQQGGLLGSIPDPTIPGYETINGSLGHGLGVACGIALALQRQNKTQKIVVIAGNGELQEGSKWEAAMFAAYHQLSNLILIVDSNKRQMLDYSENILGDEAFEAKFKAFGWQYFEVKNGHDDEEICAVFDEAFKFKSSAPKVIIVNTLKGKGLKSLENNPLAHVLSAKAEEIDEAIKEIENA